MTVRICRTGKKGFATEEDALTEVNRIVDRHKPEESGRKVPQYVNPCPYCGEFHLTRDEKWSREKPKGKAQPWGKR